MNTVTPEISAQEFAGLRGVAFLNHAAVAPLPARAAAALARYALQASCDPGNAWPAWNKGLEQARADGAQLLGADKDEVAFCHSTTHGLLTIAQGLDWRPGDNVVGCTHEFPANVYPWRGLAGRGVALRTVAERPDFTYRVEDFAAAIDRRTRLVTVSLVNYGTGYRLPVEQIAELCRARGVLFCIDAIQGVGALPVRVEELGCDFLCADGHKWMLGPEGFGLLYVRRERLDLLAGALTGWMGRPRRWDYDDTAQPLVAAARRFEEGSHNMASALALGASLALLNEVGPEAIWRSIEARTAQLRDGLARLGCEVISPAGDSQRSGILAARPRAGLPSEIATAMLREGVVMAARRGFIRFSPHFHNTEGQVAAALDALGRVMP